MNRFAAALTAIGVFALDRWSKHYVLANIREDDVKTVIPGFFNLVHSQNPGIAFSIFADNSGPWHTPALVIFSIVALAVLAAMLWKIDRLDRLSAAGMSLIFGGALGNVYDRIRVGSVVDFLDFYHGSYHWYIFNLADTAICVGAGLLLLSSFFSRKGVQA